MTWPGGLGTQLRLDGRARDLLTPVAGPPVVLADDEVSVGVAPDRTLEDIVATPARPGIDGLVGARGGAQLRAALEEVVPTERAGSTPLYLLLDDLAGASLIAGFAWTRVVDVFRRPPGERPQPPRQQMMGICAGFRPGSSTLAADGSISREMRHNVAPAPPLADAADPWSFHELAPHPAVAMRRARRIDAWLDGDAVVVDAMFRDSCWEADGTEVAVHEYGLDVVIEDGVVSSVRAEPRVLPFAECPAAAPNAPWMVGARADELRDEVLVRLRSTDCCTHLNDALRALADVPHLSAALGSAAARRSPLG